MPPRILDVTPTATVIPMPTPPAGLSPVEWLEKIAVEWSGRVRRHWGDLAGCGVRFVPDRRLWCAEIVLGDQRFTCWHQRAAAAMDGALDRAMKGE